MDHKEMFLELLKQMTADDIDKFIKENGKGPKRISPIVYLR